MRIILLVPFAALVATAAIARDNQMEAASPASYPMSGATVQDVVDLTLAKNSWCEAQKAQGKIKTNTAFVHCVYDGYVEALTAARASNVDLAVQFTSGLFMIADGLDHHKLSPTEAEAKRAELNSHLQTEFDIRVRADQEAKATQRIREATEQVQRDATQARVEGLERQQQQTQAEAQARRSRAIMCFASGLTSNPNIGIALGNAYRAQAYCAAGLPPPQPSPPPPTTTTNCMPFGPGFQCTTQ